MKELQLVNQMVIVDITESKVEQRTASGIIIPDVAREKPKTAPVLPYGDILAKVVETEEI